MGLGGAQVWIFRPGSAATIGSPHGYDGLRHLCEDLMFSTTLYYRQRKRYGIRARLLRGQILRQQHGTLYESRSEWSVGTTS
jgi:hypothetical protein